MALLRARLSALVTIWLLSHAVTLAAVPFALCCRVEMTPAVHAPDASGETSAAECPLHAQPGAASAAVAAESPVPVESQPADCTMRGVCSPSNVALESLLGAIAVLPDAAVMVVAESSSVVGLPQDLFHTHSPRLISPPPRA